MLSVVIETCNDEDALARTLASLVAAAVEGAVREVIVCDGGSTDGTRIVAEHAGCRFLPADNLAPAVSGAKADWLLLLEPGARLADGWIEPVREHVANSRKAARFRLAGGGPLFSSLFAWPRRPLARGLIVTKLEAAALARKKGGAAALARALAPKRLQARIHPPSA